MLAQMTFVFKASKTFQQFHSFIALNSSFNNYLLPLVDLHQQTLQLK